MGTGFAIETIGKAGNDWDSRYPVRIMREQAPTVALLERQSEADEVTRQAVVLLERHEPSREVANADRTQAHLRMLDRDCGRAVEIARAESLHEVVALARMNIGTSYGEQYRFEDAKAEFIDGIAFAREHDPDHSGHYMASWLAIVHMCQGRWDEVATGRGELLAQPNLAATSSTPQPIPRVVDVRGHPVKDAVVGHRQVLPSVVWGMSPTSPTSSLN